MAWFYYSGEKPTPIPVGDGEVKSVPPHTKVEIAGNHLNDKKVQVLTRLKQLKRCGAPAQPTQIKTKVESGPSGKPDPSDRFAASIVREGRATKPAKAAKVEAAATDDVKGGSEAKPKTKPSRRRRSSSSSAAESKPAETKSSDSSSDEGTSSE